MYRSLLTGVLLLMMLAGCVEENHMEESNDYNGAVNTYEFQRFYTVAGIEFYLEVDEYGYVVFSFGQDDPERIKRISGSFTHRHRTFTIDRIGDTTVDLRVKRSGIVFESGPEYVLRIGTGGFVNDDYSKYLSVVDITDDGVVFAEEFDKYTFTIPINGSVHRGLRSELVVSDLGTGVVSFSWHYLPD
jgi:hypothetical protein